MATRDELQQLTKDELYEQATDADVEGRSTMSKAELVDALADDTGDTPSTETPAAALSASDPPEVEQTVQQEAVNDGRVGLDPVLADAKAAARERDAEAASLATPYRGQADVVGREVFQAQREATRQAEAGAVRDAREGPATG